LNGLIIVRRSATLSGEQLPYALQQRDIRQVHCGSSSAPTHSVHFIGSIT
jgi:hypothetical protein